jgi:toxin YoeB
MLSIKWTEQASTQKVDILRYWILRNGSKTYANKIESESLSATLLMSKNPFIGKKSEILMM